MKRLLILSLVAGVSFAAGRIFDGIPGTAVAAAGQGGGVNTCAAKNGDVNADGKVDLSDAVTILGNLFLGNPTELVPICPSPPALSRLPATGQTKCYTDLEGQWIEAPCESVVCSGQDGAYRAGCPGEGRFVEHGDGTVIDTCTGLMWQKDTADVNGDGKIDDADQIPWCDALDYCEHLSFGGGLAAWDDWRLPNLRELQSIVDYGRFSPSIDPVFGALSASYWSSTSDAQFPANTWFVRFSVGLVDNVFAKSDGRLYVRAVRSAQ